MLDHAFPPKSDAWEERGSKSRKLVLARGRKTGKAVGTTVTGFKAYETLDAPPKGLEDYVEWRAFHGDAKEDARRVSEMRARVLGALCVDEKQTAVKKEGLDAFLGLYQAEASHAPERSARA